MSIPCNQHPKSIRTNGNARVFEVLESVPVQVKGMRMVPEKHIKDKILRESATKALSLRSPDEESETQLGIWVLLDDRGDDVGREMGK